MKRLQIQPEKFQRKLQHRNEKQHKNKGIVGVENAVNQMAYNLKNQEMLRKGWLQMLL